MHRVDTEVGETRLRNDRSGSMPRSSTNWRLPRAPGTWDPFGLPGREGQDARIRAHDVGDRRRSDFGDGQPDMPSRVVQLALTGDFQVASDA